MKTYKTWEMIKKITENPNKRFMPTCSTDNFVEFNNNQLVWKGHGQLGQVMVVTKTDEYEWKEVKEPVDFMTAVESGKQVRVEHKYITDDIEFLKTEYRLLANVMWHLCRSLSNATVQDIILNGKWYIED